MITINGRLMYSDEKPAKDGYINFKPVDSDKFEGVRAGSDSSGRFTLTIPKGAAGTRIGEMWAYKDKIENCPKLKHITEEQNSNELLTDTVDLQADVDTFDVKPIFPFPHCPKE